MSAGSVSAVQPFSALTRALNGLLHRSTHTPGRTLLRYSVLPGFGLTLGLTLSWLGLIVLVPLSALAIHAAGLGWTGFWHEVLTPRVLASLRVSFTTALAAATATSVCSS